MQTSTTSSTCPAAFSLDTLRELGQWSAVGFYEGLELPWPRAYGLAMRRLYENMSVRVPDDHLLIPFEPLPTSLTMASHNVWSAQSFILNLNHHSGLHVSDPIAAECKKQFPQHAATIDALVADLKPRLRHYCGYTHSNPDIRRVVGEGFDAMEAELDTELAKVRTTGDDPDALNLLLALKDYTVGVRTFHRNTAEALRHAADTAKGARRKDLQVIADSFAACFVKPCTTFIQGLLAVNFTWMLDGCDSIGRVDQALGLLFEQDIEAGTLDLRLARRLIDEFWHAFERLNGWNLQIGGRRPDGEDGCNALTREFILACGRNKLRRPNVAFRITQDTPDNLVVEAMKALREGSGRPALYNDDLYIRALQDLDLGLTPEDSREIGFGGCTETMIAGLSNVGSLEGEINLAKALDLAVHNGFDPVAGKQVGPATGTFADFADFEAFKAAVQTQIKTMTANFATWANSQLEKRFRDGDPKMYRTFFTRDCVKNHKSFEAGGARYNWSVVTYQGITTLIDSLATVKHCVYDERSVTPQELVDALTADFVGADAVLRKLKAAPKFGNDNPYVDDLGADIMDFACRELTSHRQARGGRFLPSCIVFATYANAGTVVNATPDGRHAKTPLNDSVGAFAGRDRNGPTALLNSVLKLPAWRMAGTPVLNLRFQKQVLSDRAGLRAAVSLIRSFFERGGMQVQISVINREDMLAAQKNPDAHQNLIVRIGGYSEYFVRLGKSLQDTVIARTEHSLS